MRSAKLYRYNLPMQSGLVLRCQKLTKRKGFLLHLCEKNQHGWGEIAPLPTFSKESLDIAEQQLRSWIANWLKGQNNSNKLDDYAPSVAFGISCALAEVHQQIGEIANYQTASLCDLTSPLIAQKLTGNLVKIKVGRGSSKEEGKKINAILASMPNLTLRLDANRAWSREAAAQFAEQISLKYRENIQFIEEPCQTPILSQQFSEQFNFNLAWDETVQENPFLFPYTPKLKAIIIKPTLIGSLKKCLNLMKLAQQRGLMTIISSSLESSFALTQLARIAQQYTPNTILGLDTLNLMQHQLLRHWHCSDLPVVDLTSSFISQVQLD